MAESPLTSASIASTRNDPTSTLRGCPRLLHERRAMASDTGEARIEAEILELQNTLKRVRHERTVL